MKNRTKAWTKWLIVGGVILFLALSAVFLKMTYVAGSRRDHPWGPGNPEDLTLIDVDTEQPVPGAEMRVLFNCYLFNKKVDRNCHNSLRSIPSRRKFGSDSNGRISFRIPEKYGTYRYQILSATHEATSEVPDSLREKHSWVGTIFMKRKTDENPKDEAP